MWIAAMLTQPGRTEFSRDGIHYWWWGALVKESRITDPGTRKRAGNLRGSTLSDVGRPLGKEETPE